MVLSNLSQSNSRIIVCGLAVILCGLFFYLDYVTPLGYLAGSPYVLVIVMVTVLNEKEKLLIFCGLSTVLIIIRFFSSDVSDSYELSIVSGVVSIVILWITTLFCISYVNSKQILMVAENNIHLVFNATPTALVMIDSTGAIELVNQKLRELFGYKEDEMIGKNIALLLSDKFQAQYQQYWGKSNEEIKRRFAAPEVELYACSKNGHEFPVEVELSPIKFARGEKVIISVEDISERKAQLELLLSNAEKLKKSNAYLEQFAYIASHDLQEPLRMVSSYTQLLANRYQDKLDDNANEFIGFAVDGAKRMQIMIQDLLKFSRLGTEGIKKEQVNVNELLVIVLDNSLALAIKENHVEVGRDDLPVINADKSQLMQLFQNLISNSIKYRSPGRICKIHISVVPKNSQWQFCVQDNGIGIEAIYAEKIFEIFKRLHSRSEYEGTGIGLALCKRIVNAHGGEIWLESEYGEGSKFYFTL